MTNLKNLLQNHWPISIIFGTNHPWVKGILDFSNEGPLLFQRGAIISPWKKGGALYLNKLQTPSPKGDLCQDWLKLAQWFWRRRFFQVVNVFSQFRNYLHLEKGGALHLNKLESPLPKDELS